MTMTKRLDEFINWEWIHAAHTRAKEDDRGYGRIKAGQYPHWEARIRDHAIRNGWIGEISAAQIARATNRNIY